MAKLSLFDLFSAYPDEVKKIIEESSGSSFLDDSDFIQKQLKSKALRDELAVGASEPTKYKEMLKNLTGEQASNYAKSRQASVDKIIKDYEIDQLLNKDRSELAKNVVGDWNKSIEQPVSPEMKKILDEKFSLSGVTDKELEARNIQRASNQYINPKSNIISSMKTPEQTSQFQTEAGVKPYTSKPFPLKDLDLPTNDNIPEIQAPEVKPIPEVKPAPVEIDTPIEIEAPNAGKTFSKANTAISDIEPELQASSLPKDSALRRILVGAGEKINPEKLAVLNKILSNPITQFGLRGISGITGAVEALDTKDKLKEAENDHRKYIDALASGTGSAAGLLGLRSGLNPVTAALGIGSLGIKAGLALNKKIWPEDWKDENEEPTQAVAPTEPNKETSGQVAPRGQDPYSEQFLLENQLEENLKQKQLDFNKANNIESAPQEPSRGPASIESQSRVTDYRALSAQDIKNIIVTRAKKFGVNPATALAIFDNETGGSFNPKQGVSKYGNVGISQMNEKTLSDVQKTFPDELKNLRFDHLKQAQNYIDAIDAGILTAKMKAMQANVDPMSSESASTIFKGYVGNPDPEKNPDAAAYSEDYTNQANDKFKFYQDYLQKANARNSEEKKISLPFRGEDNEKFAKVEKSEPKATEPEVTEKSLQDKLDAVTGEEETTPETKESTIPANIELLTALQNESDNDKKAEYQALENILGAQNAANVGRALSLLASGVAGSAGKKFVTVPKMEGMETWDKLERAPATAFALQKEFKKGRYDDPMSPISQTYQKVGSQILKQLNKNFDEKSLMGLSANSVKELLPLGIKEDSLLFKKIMNETALAAKEKNITTQKDKVLFKQIKEANEKLAGYRAGVGKNYVESVDTANRLLHATMGLPKNITLKQLTEDKDGSIVKLLNNMNPEASTEAVQVLNAILSGKGTPSQTVFKEMNPETWDKLKAEFYQYVNGKLVPANLGSFMKQYAIMALKTKMLSKANQQRSVKSIIYPFEAVFKKAPDQYPESRAYYDEMLKQSGYDNAQNFEMIDQLANTKEFGGDYEAARNALSAKGYIP